MSYPTPDDYESLMFPWKPLAAFALKNTTSAHSRIEIHRDAKVKDTAKTDSIGANDYLYDNVKQEDAQYSDTDSIDVSIVADDGVQGDSGLEDSRMTDVDNMDIDSSTSDGAQVADVEITDNDSDTPQHVDPKCVAVSTCVANSGDHRKVVSHIFGRNKACTRGLPYDLWIFWCRKHYQRFKYRAEDAENWHIIQLGLVRKQLQTFDDWGKVGTWTITIRKAEQQALAEENKNGTTYTDHISSCWERFLLPYTGPNKTFAQVREVLNLIERKFNETEYRNRDKKSKTFPGVEFLPSVPQAKAAKKPAGGKKKGEIRYKKITLDQPAFKRKTRANNQFLKAQAAKKDEPSRAAKGPATGSTEDNPTSTSNASITAKQNTATGTGTSSHTAYPKRKSPNDTTTTTPRPTKRRRLTRGYEKHGDHTTVKEPDDDEE